MAVMGIMVACLGAGSLKRLLKNDGFVGSLAPIPPLLQDLLHMPHGSFSPDKEAHPLLGYNKPGF